MVPIEVKLHPQGFFLLTLKSYGLFSCSPAWLLCSQLFLNTSFLSVIFVGWFQFCMPLLLPTFLFIVFTQFSFSLHSWDVGTWQVWSESPLHSLNFLPGKLLPFHGSPLNNISVLISLTPSWLQVHMLIWLCLIWIFSYPFNPNILFIWSREINSFF